MYWELARAMLEKPWTWGDNDNDSQQQLLIYRTSKQYHQTVVANALKYLEKQLVLAFGLVLRCKLVTIISYFGRFLIYMEKVVYGNLAEAKRGGVPGVLALVQAYLNVRMPVPFDGYLVTNYLFF